VSEPQRDRPGFALSRALLHGRPRTGGGLGGAFVWLLFIVFPLINAVADSGPALRHWLAIAGAAAFVGAYVALVLVWRRRQPGPLPIVLFAVLLADATALTLAERPGWGFLFTYCAACTALISPARVGLIGIAACTGLAGGVSLLAGASGGEALGFVASTAGIGLLMLVMRDLRTRNAELTEARAELARLAVAEERARFARDLHDLLGHSLSVIALKSELAGRLLPERPEAALEEMRSVEQVARSALAEVREAVSGYRQPTLDDELAGARLALSAAGIDADVERPAVTLDPEVEAVLAWAVREGATNVIRHSGASRCIINVRAGLADAGVELVDDGAGARSVGGNGAGGGHGLAGLAERVKRLHGRLDAGAAPGGGFRLSVTVPVPRT
jgi:two-component system sensor histidine kinase DesK